MRTSFQKVILQIKGPRKEKAFIHPLPCTETQWKVVMLGAVAAFL